MLLPAPLQDVINALERLPGIGPKSAARLAFYLLQAPEDVSLSLAQALQALKQDVVFCQRCYNLTTPDQPECRICASHERDTRVLCVVEEPMDVLALERTGGFHGRYHVLHGVLSPIEGVGPDDLKIAALLRRIPDEGVEEVILATNPSMEGDATALYLRQQLLPLGVRITRLARGLPMGSDLEYADQNTLLRALAGRQPM